MAEYGSSKFYKWALENKLINEYFLQQYPKTFVMAALDYYEFIYTDYQEILITKIRKTIQNGMIQEDQIREKESKINWDYFSLWLTKNNIIEDSISFQSVYPKLFDYIKQIYWNAWKEFDCYNVFLDNKGDFEKVDITKNLDYFKHNRLKLKILEIINDHIKWKQKEKEIADKAREIAQKDIDNIINHHDSYFRIMTLLNPKTKDNYVIEYASRWSHFITWLFKCRILEKPGAFELAFPDIFKRINNLYQNELANYFLSDELNSEHDEYERFMKYNGYFENDHDIFKGKKIEEFDKKFERYLQLKIYKYMRLELQKEKGFKINEDIDYDECAPKYIYFEWWLSQYCGSDIYKIYNAFHPLSFDEFKECLQRAYTDEWQNYSRFDEHLMNLLLNEVKKERQKVIAEQRITKTKNHLKKCFSLDPNCSEE